MGQDDTRRLVGRRSLIKWGLAAGAALGVPRWKVFEVLGASGGKALADEAACVATNRSVHIVAGRGGFAWFQLLWPHIDVARARNDRFAWHAIGDELEVPGTDRPLVLGPESPFAEATAPRQVTCLLAGTNQTHTNTPDSNSQVSMNSGLFATCAAIQTANPTVVPVIAIDDVPYRDAPGAPRVARVGSADDVVSLFNAAASRAGALLSDPAHADLFAAQYSAFLSLRAAAGTPVNRDPFAAATSSARLLGRNLADQLRPTDADMIRYGADGGARAQNRAFARALIVTAKAFAMGLTSSVIIPAFRDDPHQAFNDLAALRNTVTGIGRALDAFYEDLEVDDATCAGSTVGDNTVLSIHGDTPKNPLDRTNWPDGTPGDSNWVYVRGAGHLKTGWFGGIDRDANVTGWNPTTGAEQVGISSAATASSAAAAVAYAVAKGDMRRVNDFYRGADLRGIVSSETV